MVQNKKLRVPLHILFALYITALLLYSFGILGSGRGLIVPLRYPEWSYIETSVNFVPFKTMFTMLDKLSQNQINTDIVSSFFVGNIISFIPLTVFLRLLYNNQLVRILLTVTAISILLETLQLFTMVGVLDIDAIILRCIGTAVTYALFSVVVYAKEKRKLTHK